MLLEWAAVTLAGAFGGFVGSVFLRLDTDASWPGALSDYLDKHTVFGFVANVARSTILGGLAGFIAWGLYNPHADFAAAATSPLQVATAALVGLGGVGFVNNLARRQQAERTVQDQAQAIIDLTKTLEEEAEE